MPEPLSRAERNARARSQPLGAITPSPSLTAFEVDLLSKARAADDEATRRAWAATQRSEQRREDAYREAAEALSSHIGPACSARLASILGLPESQPEIAQLRWWPSVAAGDLLHRPWSGQLEAEFCGAIIRAQVVADTVCDGMAVVQRTPLPELSKDDDGGEQFSDLATFHRAMARIAFVDGRELPT